MIHFRLLLVGFILHRLNYSSAQDGSDGVCYERPAVDMSQMYQNPRLFQENVVIEPPPVFGIGLDLPQYRLADVQLSCPEGQSHRNSEKIFPSPGRFAEIRHTFLSGWDLLAPNCYKLYPTRKSWPQALTVCNR